MILRKVSHHNYSYIPRYFTSKAIFLFFILLLICLLVFYHSILPLQWGVFGSITVIGFFYFSNRISKSWRHLTNKAFIKRLFFVSLIVRLVIVVFLFYYFTFVNGEPFEFETADAKSYHNLAISLSDIIRAGQSNVWPYLESLSFSDKGFPIYLGFTYLLSYNSILLIRIFNALLGAFSVIIIYKISKRNFNEKTARIAAILMMLLPNLIYYTGLHLKETLMIFLLIAFTERADFLLRNRKMSLRNIVLVSMLGASLFLFRTVLGATAFAALFGALIFTSSHISRWRKRFFSAIWIVLVAFIFLSEKIIEETEQYWNQSNTNLERQMSHFSTREGANTFAEYGSAAIFAPIILFAPFPTLVDVEGQENQMMLGGAYYTRNIYAFFVVIGLFALYKKKQVRYHLLIILFIILYLGVLANSGFALSERFHLPVVPFLVILAAFGINKINKKNKRYFVPYLIVISIIVIGWNWFKLAGRGML